MQFENAIPWEDSKFENSRKQVLKAFKNYFKH